MSMRDFFLQIILHFFDKIWDLVVILLFRFQIILLFVGAVIFGVAVLWPRPTYQRWIAGVLSSIMLAGTIILSRDMIAGHQEPLPRIGAKKEGETGEMPPPKRGHVAPPQVRHDQEKLEREKDNTLSEWPRQECSRATEPDEKFGNDKPSEKDELIKNPNFEYFYQPAWSAEIHDRNASIEQSENFVRIFFNGEGTNSKAVELYQIAKVSDPKDLIFNLRIKISDFENEGFPVGTLIFMDHSDRKVFQIIFTPDKHYKPKANDYLYPIHNGLLENITISPLGCARKQLPLDNYEKSTKVKISFYIVVPSGFVCKRCIIEVHNVSLTQGKEMKGVEQ